MSSLMCFGLALLVGYLLFPRIRCDLSADATDCRVRPREECSDMGYALVGECDQTTGNCSCNTYNGTEIECFFYDSSSNYCQIRDCWRFSNSTGECTEGIRKQNTALLLSIFLINFGAANFYIERYDLAVPQIILGLMLCFFQFGSCAVAAKRDDDTSKLCIFCCSVNTVFSLFFLSWWIADLIIFANNARDDGDGCPLN